MRFSSPFINCRSLIWEKVKGAKGRPHINPFVAWLALKQCVAMCFVFYKCTIDVDDPTGVRGVISHPERSGSSCIELN